MHQKDLIWEGSGYAHGTKVPKTSQKLRDRAHEHICIVYNRADRREFNLSVGVLPQGRSLEEMHQKDHVESSAPAGPSRAGISFMQIKILQSFVTPANYYNFLRRKRDFQWFLFMISTRTRTEDHFTLFIKFHLFSSMEQIFIFTEKLGKRTWSKLYWEDLESRVKHCGRCEI